MKDRKGKKCECGGRFEERSLWDDWDGTVTCSKCAKVVKRWQREEQ